MIGWIAGRVIGGIASSAISSAARQPAPPPPRDPGVGGLVIFLIMLPFWAATIASARSGHVSGWLLNFDWIGFIALMPVVWAVMRLAERSKRASRRREIHRKYAPKPDTRVADWRALAADIEEREQRVADLLSVPCPYPPWGCAMAAGDSCCNTGPPFAVLSTDPVLCHLSRVHRAVREGHASRDDVLTQYGGEVPHGLITL